MSGIEVTAASYSAAGRALVADADLACRPGSLTVLVGPNGAGKTTLLRMAMGLLAPASGRVTIDGEPIAALAPIARARRIAYLPQARPLAWPQPVRDVVALGRFAYGAAPGRLSDADCAAIDAALATCDLVDLAERASDTLSGGELARVHLARALAAQTPLIGADEPVAALDPLFQHQTMAIFRAAADAGRGVIAVIHDLSLAGRYADRMVWMQHGRIVAAGSPAETMTEARIRVVFGVNAQVRHGSDGAVRVDILGRAD
jgi:iron complex transport system ATP-binding protein